MSDAAIRRLRAAGVGACLLLAGCAGDPGASPAPAAAPATRAPDWRDTTYTVTCDGVVPDGFAAPLRDGAARVAAEAGPYDWFDVSLAAAVGGDVDGDGRPDTVVLLRCSPQPSNGIVEEVHVLDADGRPLAVLPSPRTLPRADVLPPVYDPDGLSVEDGRVVAVMRVYEPGDTHAGGPSGRMTVRWQWDGGELERLP
ncbi:hypothetical protein ACI8AA_18655 [Geodermatophilus sp. SYSU D01180]